MQNVVLFTSVVTMTTMIINMIINMMMERTSNDYMYLIPSILSQDYSRVLVHFAISILFCVFIHDSNYQLHVTYPNVTQDRTGLSLVSMIDMSSFIELCDQPANMVCCHEFNE